jgi:hypothetical protein
MQRLILSDFLCRGKMRTSPFWGVTQCSLVFCYRRFGTVSHLKMPPTGCSETSVTIILRFVTSQKSESLVYTSRKVWNHASCHVSSNQCTLKGLFLMTAGYIYGVTEISMGVLKDCPITVLDRLLGLQEIQAARILRKSAGEGGKVVSPTHRPCLPPGRIYGTHFC